MYRFVVFFFYLYFCHDILLVGLKFCLYYHSITLILFCYHNFYSLHVYCKICKCVFQYYLCYRFNSRFICYVFIENLLSFQIKVFLINYGLLTETQFATKRYGTKIKAERKQIQINKKYVKKALNNKNNQIKKGLKKI